MKKNTLLFLLMAVGCKSAQAMNGAREFAKQVFRSKTALVAAGIAGCNLGGSYLGKKILQEEYTNAPETEISWHSQGPILSMFERRGYFDVKIIDSNSVGVARFDDKVIIMLDDKIKQLLQEALCLYLREQKGEFLPILLKKAHALAVLRHERSHVVNNDGKKKRTLDNSIEPVAILTGKAVHASGRGKIAALAAGMMSYGTGKLGYYWYARHSEFRADRDAATDKKSALELAQYLASHPEEWDFLQNLTTTHPTTSARIKALEKQHGRLDLSYIDPKDHQIVEEAKTRIS